MNFKMLNISIKKLTPKIFERIKNENVVIKEKYDGTKLNLFKHNDEIIISYKNEILFESEFKAIKDKNISKSFGNAQYKRVFEYFSKYKDYFNQLPNETEMFFEFIQRKPTLTRLYKKYHSLIFLKATKSHITKTTDRIFSEPQKQITLVTPFKTPQVLFSGKLNNFETFGEFKDYFLNLESEFGGKMEGIVIEGNNFLYKLTQDNQFDKDYRKKIKSLFYLNDYKKEKSYWKKIYSESDLLTKKLDINENNFSEKLFEIVSDIYSISDVVLFNKYYCKIMQQLEQNKSNELNENYNITKNVLIQKVRDDLHSISKLLASYKLKENQNTLIIGKFRVFTRAHLNMIEEALKFSHKVVLCIIRPKKETQKSIPFEIQKNIIENKFKDRVVVIQHSTGNLFSILGKSPLKIKYLMCGSDRVEDYKKQIEKTTVPFEIIEYKRDNDISATKLIECFNQKNYVCIDKYLSIGNNLEEKIKYLENLR